MSRSDKIYEPKKHFPRTHIIAERFERKQKREAKELAEQKAVEDREREVEIIKGGIEQNYGVSDATDSGVTAPQVPVESKTTNIEI